jgi:hypothetical protein
MTSFTRGRKGRRGEFYFGQISLRFGVFALKVSANCGKVTGSLPQLFYLDQGAHCNEP